MSTFPTRTHKKRTTSPAATPPLAIAGATIPVRGVRRWSNRLVRQPVTLVSVLLAALLVIACVAAPWLTRYDPAAVELHLGLQRPSMEHWLGTDQLGRDVASRVLWAGRTSIGVMVAVLVMASATGLAVGLITGYWGGKLDDLGMRITEFFDGLPQIVIALAVIGAVGPSTMALVIALAVTGWARYARLSRSLVLRTRSEEYVTAAAAMGASSLQIIRRHLLPAIGGSVAVQISLDAGGIVLAIAGLSFLGLGIQPPTPEWGTMLVEARPYLDYAPHLVLPPGIAIFIVVLGCNTLGEWLDDALRPQN